MLLNLFAFSLPSFNLNCLHLHCFFSRVFLFQCLSFLLCVMHFALLVIFSSVQSSLLLIFLPLLQKSKVIQVLVLTGKLEKCSDGLLPPLGFLSDEGQFDQTQEENQLASSQGNRGHQIAWPHHVKLHLRGQKREKCHFAALSKCMNSRFLES